MAIQKPAWITQFETKGWAIVPKAVPTERADAYATEALNWLEKFPLGFDRNNKDTWTKANLPDNWKNGIYNFYGVSHEKFVWDIRQEPGIIQAFADLWGTDELLVSFDGINISLPVGAHGRTDIVPGKWPHMDQAVTRPGFQLAQGIFAATKSGPNDGGLVLLEGSHTLAPKLFAATGGWKPEQDRGEDVNSYQYTSADCDWFLSQPGVKEVKVEAEAGDLIIWDSRTVHWNCTPLGTRTRVATYVCYCPTSYAPDADSLVRKTEIYNERKATTHWPQLNVVPEDNLGGPKRDGQRDPYFRSAPFVEPVLSKTGRKLAGFV